MGRELWSGLLLAVGLLAVAGSLFVLGLTGQVRDTSVVQQATPEWLAVDEVHDAIAAELSAALDRAFPTLAITEAEQAFAVERMLANGDLIDEIESAMEPAHRSWLAGSEFALELDPRVVTAVAATGIRDANPALTDALNPQSLVDPGLIELPVWVSSATVDSYQSGAQMALAGGVIIVTLGLFMGFRHRGAWLRLGRGIIGFGLLTGVVALVLPWSEVSALDGRLGVVGALIAPARIPWLVIAGVAVAVGLAIHGRADRFSVQRPRAQTKPDPAPTRSKTPTPATTRQAGRHRAEAIDAFFDPIEQQPTTPATVIELDDLEAEGPPADEAEPGTDEPLVASNQDPDTDGEGEGGPRRDLTPEEERAEALAAERREALERIDGTRSRYRTHLRR